MMRSPSSWAVAVRKPDGKIAQVVNEIASPMAKRRIWRLPVIRGVIALGESLAIGFRALAISANYAAQEETEEGEEEKEVPTELRVGQLTTAEADRDLDPVTLFKEFDRAMHLRIEVADPDLGREPDFLEGHRSLLALGFLLALGQIVFVLSEIEELDDWG